VGAAADPGSFRDPTSRVFVTDEGVFRGLTAEGLAGYEAAAAAPFLGELQDEGALVRTELVEPGAAPDLGEGWAGVLRHERVPVITYPYEWTFEMLRDAGLAHLEVTRRALEGGCITKDASAYNLQFEGVRPVFIDVGSFEGLVRGEPWPGYRQLCSMFLNPLVLTATTGVDFHPWLRGSLEGLAPADLARLVPLRRRVRKGLAVHVGLQARAERRWADRDAERDVRAEMRSAGFGPKVIRGQLDNLERALRGLRWRAQSSTWSGYGDRSHYSDADLDAKEAMVADAARSLAPGLVLDLGANDGRFSRVALANGAARSVAVDADHLVVDRLYRDLRDEGEQRILPLVLDLAAPSPGRGWRGAERRPFTDRVRPDLVLCLALVHHLALTATIPFEEIVAWLADLGAPLVVELPHPEDPMAARLLARKRPGTFDHYSVAGWERALGARFDLDERVPLPSGHRTLYRCTPRPGP
jgi:hypothetical protein